MPAKDRYHAQVIRALTKAGWAITGQQISLILAERRLWVDIRAFKVSPALVEVKGFENMPSPIDYLESAVGQYVLYQAALEYLSIATPLFLAVPEAAYNGILSEDIGQAVIRKADIHLVVFNPELEEIVQWIP